MKIKYDTPDAGGWRDKADDLFLEQFRGLPCEVCGDTFSIIKGKKIRSCGHHGIEKDLCRSHRYDKNNIIILCPNHHNRQTGNISPHSKNPVEQGLWWQWLRENNRSKWMYVIGHYEDKFNKEWTYVEKYVELGGKVESLTGLVKDRHPLNHAESLRNVKGNL